LKVENYGLAIKIPLTGFVRGILFRYFGVIADKH
jgi:hypothetical protein